MTGRRRIRTRSRSNGKRSEVQTSNTENTQLEVPTVEVSGQNTQNLVRDSLVNRNDSIPINQSHSASVPTDPNTLPQQHMDASELRELIYKLSDNQASMMELFQSMIEPNSGENLNSLHLYNIPLGV